MSALAGIFAIWYREFKVFTREKSRAVAAIINPLMWFVIMGGGIGASVTISGLSYQTFLFPGILVIPLSFTSVFYGAYLVWDKRIDFLKEVLVAPLSRTTIFVGKVLGGITDSFIEVSILIVIGALIGFRYGFFQFFGMLLVLFLAILTMVSIGLLIGSMMESPEGFQLLSSFIVLPMLFLSGAFFPIDNLPAYLEIPNSIDPLTYAVDALRGLLLGLNHFPYSISLAVLAGYAVIMIIIGGLAFNRMKV